MRRRGSSRTGAGLSAAERRLLRASARQAAGLCVVCGGRRPDGYVLRCQRAVCAAVVQAAELRVRRRRQLAAPVVVEVEERHRVRS